MLAVSIVGDSPLSRDQSRVLVEDEPLSEVISRAQEQQTHYGDHPCYFTWICRWKLFSVFEANIRTWVAFSAGHSNKQPMIGSQPSHFSSLGRENQIFSNVECASCCGSFPIPSSPSNCVGRMKLMLKRFDLGISTFLCLPLMWKKIQFPFPNLFLLPKPRWIFNETELRIINNLRDSTHPSRSNDAQSPKSASWKRKKFPAISELNFPVTIERPSPAPLWPISIKKSFSLGPKLFLSLSCGVSMECQSPFE